jgi:hypothetical protein
MTGWSHGKLAGDSEKFVVLLIRHLDERLSAMELLNNVTRRMQVTKSWIKQPN